MPATRLRADIGDQGMQDRSPLFQECLDSERVELSEGELAWLDLRTEEREKRKP